MYQQNAARVAVTAVVVVLGNSAPAVADAHGNASCIGFEASGIAPPASSEEFPGGVAELQEFLHDSFPHESGALISEVAHQHLGSHEACDAGE